MLDVAVIRKVAADCCYTETVHHRLDGIIIFSQEDPKSIDGSVVSIWYQRGTVGVSLSHPRWNRVTSFFFDVNEQNLHDIMTNQANQAFGYMRKGSSDVSTEMRELLSSPEMIETEEAALRRQVSIAACASTE